MSITPLPRLLNGLVLAAVAALTAPGCAMINALSAARPIDDSHMSHAIAAIAPIGTPRDETVRRLIAAGIEGNFVESGFKVADGKTSLEPHEVSPGDTAFFAQRWKRPNGEDWLIDVMLSFDAAGRLDGINSSSKLGKVPTTVRVVRRRCGPDGAGFSFFELGRDADVPRLLQATSMAANTPGNANAPNPSATESAEFLPPKIAIGISDSPNAFDNLP